MNTRSRPTPGGHRPVPPPRRPVRAVPTGQLEARDRRRRRPPRQRRFSIGSVLVWTFTILILAVGALAGAVYVISPGELVRTQLVQQVKSNTGRTLTIGGSPSLTFYPGLGVSLPNIALSPPPGMDGGPTIRADNVRVYVELMPLLSSRVVVQQLTLDRPVIDLRVDRSGRASWQFAQRQGAVRLAHLPTAVGHVANDAGRPETLVKRTAVYGCNFECRSGAARQSRVAVTPYQ